MNPLSDRDNPSTGMVQRTINGRTYQMMGKRGDEKATAKMLIEAVENNLQKGVD